MSIVANSSVQTTSRIPYIKKHCIPSVASVQTEEQVLTKPMTTMHHRNYNLRKNINSTPDGMRASSQKICHLNKIYIEQKINHHKASGNQCYININCLEEDGVAANEMPKKYQSSLKYIYQVEAK